MKKLTSFVALFLIFMSCEQSDIQNEPINSPVLELKNVKSLDISPTNGRVMDSEISELKEITVNLDGQEMTGQIAILDNNSNTQRIAMLGSDGVVYSYVDISDNNGVLNARYYTHSGELYLETTLENDVISINGAYSLSGSTNGHVNGFFDRFDNCVDDFVETVSNDAGWAAVMTVGAICCPAEVLAGLAIGCSISAL
jgi:hypothetical protein